VGAVRVLTVDDHATFRQAATALIAATDGFEAVGVARSGLEAVVAAERLSPDLILMDIGLPDIDGYEAARRIAVFRPAALIVLISVADEALAGDPTERCGAAAFVRKEDLRPALLRDLWATHRLPKAEEPPAASVGPA
jgi:two-component system invasion response regulator UvrY